MATDAERRMARELAGKLAEAIGTEPEMKDISFDEERETVIFETGDGTALSLPLDEFLALYSIRH